MTTSADNWLDLLRAACAETTQTAVAKRLEVSPAMINQALKGNYKGDLNRLRVKVEGVLGGQTVACPVIDNLPKHKCLKYQNRDPKLPETVNSIV